MTTDYRAIDAVNWSTLKSMRVSPKQYRHDLERVRDETVAMRVGLAAHALVLEPATWETEYAVWEGTRRGKAWDAFKAEHAGKTILTTPEAARATGCARAILEHPLAKQHMAHGVAEKICTWTDPGTGIACKGRMDAVNGHLVEIKSTADIAPSRFAATCARMGYHGQLAFYLDGLKHSGVFTGKPSDPAMIVVQSDAPFDVVVYLVGEDTVEQGRDLYRALLQRLKDCRERDEWPGICDTVEHDLLLPAWANDDLGPVAEEPITSGGVPLF